MSRPSANPETSRICSHERTISDADQRKIIAAAKWDAETSAANLSAAHATLSTAQAPSASIGQYSHERLSANVRSSVARRSRIRAGKQQSKSNAIDVPGPGADGVAIEPTSGSSTARIESPISARQATRAREMIKAA